MKPCETKATLEVASLNADPEQEPQVQEFDDLTAYLEQKGIELWGPHFTFRFPIRKFVTYEL